MSKKTGVIFGLIIVLLFSLGCTRIDGEEGAIDWRSGSSSIEMNFLGGSPPPAVYDGDEVSLYVEMWNKGAYEANGVLYFTGFDPEIIDIEKEHSFDIEDKLTRYNQEGGYDTVGDVGVIYLPEGTDVFRTPIKAVACFPYQTQASVHVCIDPEPYKGYRDDACTVGARGISGGQAGPVAVTSVREEAMKEKARFRITLKNIGDGVVIAPNRWNDDEKCEGVFDHEDLNKVYVDVSLGVGEYLECEPDNPIRLVNGVGNVYCTYDNIDSGSAYMTLMNVKIDYGYKVSASTNLEIRSAE